MASDFERSLGDLARKSDNGEKMLTRFLDLEEQSIASSLRKQYDLTFFGGFSGAERKRAIINKRNSKISEFKIIAYQIIYPSMLNITHRAILGTLMSIGLKRNNIGDIIVTNNEAYFLICSEVEQIIEREFSKINGAPITLKKISYDKLENLQCENAKQLTIIVPSLRLDAIVAEGFQLSRKEAKDEIEKGLVFINNKQMTKSDFEIKIDDIISFRHHGRIKLVEIGPMTRKERLVIKVEVYQ